MVWKNRCLTGTKPPDTVWGSDGFDIDINQKLSLPQFHNKATRSGFKSCRPTIYKPPPGGPVPVRILFPVQQQ